MDMCEHRETVPQPWVNCPRASEDGSWARGQEKDTPTGKLQFSGRHNCLSLLRHWGETWFLIRLREVSTTLREDFVDFA